MTKTNIIDYVLDSPQNTNKAVLTSILNQYEAEITASADADDPVAQEITITTNGVTNAPTGTVYNKITVNVPDVPDVIPTFTLAEVETDVYTLTCSVAASEFDFGHNGICQLVLPGYESTPSTCFFHIVVTSGDPYAVKGLIIDNEAGHKIGHKDQYASYPLMFRCYCGTIDDQNEYVWNLTATDIHDIGSIDIGE